MTTKKHVVKNKDELPDSVVHSLTFIPPIDHVDELPPGQPDYNSCWVGPDIEEMYEIQSQHGDWAARSFELIDIEWKGKSLAIKDWGQWVSIEGEWLKVEKAND